VLNADAERPPLLSVFSRVVCADCGDWITRKAGSERFDRCIGGA